MGLFSKKPKSIIVQRPATKAPPQHDAIDLEYLLPKADDNQSTLAPPPAAGLFEAPPPAPEVPATPVAPIAPVPPIEKPAPKPPTATSQSRPSKPTKAPKKNKKFSVDPADFLALRAELIDVKARLDESEQARAMVEARLGSLDAAAAAFTNERSDITEVTNMVMQLQEQVERSTANEVTAAPTLVPGARDELSAKVDALQNRLFGLQDQAPKIAEFESQIAQLRGEVEAAAVAAAIPPLLSHSLPDPETIARLDALQQQLGDLDQLRQRVGDVEQLSTRIGELDTVDQRLQSIDGIAAQLQQLNARVAAQAELGGQISALRDRVTLLTEQPRGADDDIRLQLQEIGERLRSTEAMRAQIEQLAERAAGSDTEARAVRDHMAKLDQRLTNVSTELANQLSELGRDIDGLAQRAPEVAEGNVSDEVIDALRGGQAKLASEQARYEIAFRQDLAALAEQLRKSLGDK